MNHNQERFPMVLHLMLSHITGLVGYAQYDVQGVRGFLGVKLWRLLLLLDRGKALH